MFCRKCGTEFRAGARFCGKCGSPKPVIKPAAAKATTSSASAPKKVLETPKRSPETPKPEKKSVLISSKPKPGSSGSSSNGQFDNWFSDPGDL